MSDRHDRHGPYKSGDPVLVFVPAPQRGYSFQWDATYLSDNGDGTVKVRLWDSTLNPKAEISIAANAVKKWTFWD